MFTSGDPPRVPEVPVGDAPERALDNHAPGAAQKCRTAIPESEGDVKTSPQDAVAYLRLFAFEGERPDGVRVRQ